MTERQKREQSGERAMFSMHRGDSTGRLYFSFTPTLFQMVTAFVVMLGSLFGAARWYEENILYHRLMERGRGEMNAISATHATKSEVAVLQLKLEEIQRNNGEREQRYLTELAYLRMRIDQIADRMGVK